MASPLDRSSPPFPFAARFKKSPSFTTVHLGVDAEAIPAGSYCHHIVLEDWAKMEDSRGVLFVSIPTVLDPSLAPEGKHIVHAFVPDWIEDWEGLEPGERPTPAPLHWLCWGGDRMDGRSAAPCLLLLLASWMSTCAVLLLACSLALTRASTPTTGEYQRRKEELADKMVARLEAAAFPGLSRHVRFREVGTPRTHRKFLNRVDGTYGPIPSRRPLGMISMPFNTTAVHDLYCVGDSTFPGQGVNAVVFSGGCCWFATAVCCACHWTKCPGGSGSPVAPAETPLCPRDAAFPPCPAAHRVRSPTAILPPLLQGLAAHTACWWIWAWSQASLPSTVPTRSCTTMSVTPARRRGRPTDGPSTHPERMR